MILFQFLALKCGGHLTEYPEVFVCVKKGRCIILYLIYFMKWAMQCDILFRVYFVKKTNVSLLRICYFVRSELFTYLEV